MMVPEIAAPETEPLEKLAGDIVQLWMEGGQTADTLAVLRQYPELAGSSEHVAELAAVEFEQRKKNGEHINPKAFCERFAGYRSAVFKMIMAQDLLVNNPGFQPSDRSWPEPGDMWLTFELLRPLGHGAFARAFLAREPAMGNRLVAVKIALLGGSAEAEILGRLSHDNIVPVYSIRQDELTKLTATAMPYLGETTLEDIVDYAFSGPEFPASASLIIEAARPRPGQEEIHARLETSPVLEHGTYVDGVLHLAVQLADALAFVHERDIYHRDLKPSNVLVRPDGKPMLLDFNLSFSPQGDGRYIGGTPLYMSPELLRATDKNYTGPCLLGAPSDLYSLGVILYEMLSGKHPFRSVRWQGTEEEKRSRLSDAQRLGPPRLRTLVPRLDRNVAAVVERCLAYEARDRFQSAAELVKALRRCLSRPQRLRRYFVGHPRALLATGLAAIVPITALTMALMLRAPYPEREFKSGLEAYQRGHYAQAIGHFTRSLTEEESPRIRLARGRAHEKNAEFEYALQDFLLVDKAAPSGQSKARLAYCYNQMDRYDLAIFRYQDAISNGFQTAIVFNNLGYSLMRQGRGAELEGAQNLRRAIREDPGLQIAYYNLAMLRLAEACNSLRRTPVSGQELREGVEAIMKAIELGANEELHRQAARLHVKADRVEPRWRELALDHVEKAIDLGLPLEKVKRDPIFNPLRDDPRFRGLLERPAAEPPVRIRRILDPLEDEMARLANQP
jgi:serine/threonine protein kinase